MRVTVHGANLSYLVIDDIAEWRGYTAAAPRVALFADQGSFTFTIQATQATTGFTSLYRGALQVQR